MAAVGEPFNPGGNMGMGAIVLRGEETLWTLSEHVPAHPSNSNNVAEYTALNRMLTWLMQNNFEKEDILIRGDSKLAIMQMRGEWKTKAGRYVALAKDAQNKRIFFPNTRYEWIPRDLNGLADELSKAPMIAAGVEFKIQPE